MYFICIARMWTVVNLTKFTRFSPEKVVRLEIVSTMAWWLYSKSSGQWFDVLMVTSDKWCSLRVGIGTSTIDHLCWQHEQWDWMQFIKFVDDTKLCDYWIWGLVKLFHFAYYSFGFLGIKAIRDICDYTPNHN